MMMIWSQKLCAWVPWRGSHAAWLRLPHIAALAGACLGAGPSAALPLAPHDTGMSAHRMAQRPASPLQKIVPMGWIIPPDFAPTGLQSDPYPQAPLPLPMALSPSPSAPPIAPPIPAPPPVNVPEPPGALILATAISTLVLTRRLTCNR
jgi:hypothetical protein